MNQPTIGPNDVPLEQASVSDLEGVVAGQLLDGCPVLCERFEITRAIAHRLLIEKLGLA
jgi:hypothetical protein